MKVNPPIAAAAQILKPHVAKGATESPPWRGFLHQSANHIAAWADQAVVSGTSFLTLIMIGRWTGPDHLGAYAIAASVLAMLLAVQESLITRPYAIQLDRLPGAPTEHTFSSLVLSILLSAVATCVLSAAALALSAAGAPQSLVEITWALTATTPFVLVREFARRFAFAHLKIFHVLIVDGADDICCGDPKFSKPVRPYPKAHGKVASTADIRAAYAGQTRQFVSDVDRRIIAEKQIIVATVW